MKLRFIVFLCLFNFIDCGSFNSTTSTNVTNLNSLNVFENVTEVWAGNKSLINLRENETALVENSYDLATLLKPLKDLVKVIYAKVFKIYQKYLNYVNDLWKDMYLNDSPKMSSVMINLSTLVITLFGLLLYGFPELKNGDLWFTDKSQIQKIGTFGRNLEEMSVSINKVIDTYFNLEPEVCLKMALCALGNSKLYNKKHRSRTLDTINTILT